ncbi:MAG: type II toxin-antitoxin system VapC family toxin [Mycobacteriales bacterium]
MIVLDTNVVSEFMRTAPSAAVVGWVQAQSAPQLCTTAVTLAEIRYGIARLSDGRRKEQLLAAAEDVFTMFADRVLAFDAAAAADYAGIVVARSLAGTPISGFDAQIAAVCRRHGATLASRNTNDFDGVGLALVDPWSDGGRRAGPEARRRLPG